IAVTDLKRRRSRDHRQWINGYVETALSETVWHSACLGVDIHRHRVADQIACIIRSTCTARGIVIVAYRKRRKLITVTCHHIGRSVHLRGVVDGYRETRLGAAV